MTVSTERPPRTLRELRRIAFACVLWTSAIALMILGTAMDHHHVSRWSLLTGLAATVASADCLAHYVVNRLTQIFGLWATDVATPADNPDPAALAAVRSLFPWRDNPAPEPTGKKPRAAEELTAGPFDKPDRNGESCRR